MTTRTTPTASAVIGEATPTMLSCRQLSVDVAGARLLQGVSLDVRRGGWLTVVGPNGAGKTTLLRAIAGLVAVTGDIRLAGAPSASLTRRERARLVALVPQVPVVPPGMSVSEYVLLGRTPHLPVLGTEGDADLALTHRVLVQLGLLPLAPRFVETLSGGERQRVLVARALAQESPILLLDEPTTSLDVGHQQAVLELVDDLRARRGLTVLSTMHDLTLAGQYADRLVLLDGGRVAVSGTAEDVLTEDVLDRHYGAQVRVLRDADGPIVVPRRPPRARPG